MECMSTHMPKINAIALLDPWPWWEGFYGFGSVHPSVQKFSWDWLTSFSETHHGLEAHMVLCVTAGIYSFTH